MTTADRIRQEEGNKAFVYDDATGQPITKGTLVKGYPTIGVGYCVDAFKGHPLPKQVSDLWLQILLDEITEGLTTRWAPFVDQPQEVQGALEEMAYQLGITGVLGFTDMLAALQNGDRVRAAAAALDSTWHKETPKRAERVAALIRGV